VLRIIRLERAVALGHIGCAQERFRRLRRRFRRRLQGIGERTLDQEITGIERDRAPEQGGRRRVVSGSVLEFALIAQDRVVRLDLDRALERLGGPP